MSKKILLLLFSIVVSLSSFARQKNVLVLNSYNSGLSWTDNINRAIFSSFKDENNRTVDLRCEFMDAKHFEGQDFFLHYKGYLQHKYRNVSIDLIICADNAAFDFLSKYHTELFKGIPVVFCGVNYCDSIPKGFTGVIEDVDLEANLTLITDLHPDYNKLYNQ